MLWIRTMVGNSSHAHALDSDECAGEQLAEVALPARVHAERGASDDLESRAAHVPAECDPEPAAKRAEQTAEEEAEQAGHHPGAGKVHGRGEQHGWVQASREQVERHMGHRERAGLARAEQQNTPLAQRRLLRWRAVASRCRAPLALSLINI